MDTWMFVLLVIGILVAGVPTIYGLIEGLIDGLCERRYIKEQQKHIERHMKTRNIRNYKLINSR